ncbi:MAG: hypothetical protein JWM18_783 [Chloroflexi bacterium]|jgi:ketosteroid isomerase-like protein|nr:hypothetical protein [Chloroflexota bacterium]
MNDDNKSSQVAAFSSPKLTPQLLADAYQALASGDRQKCSPYWDENMVWTVPGHSQISGVYRGLDEFLQFMARVGELSGDSFRMEPIALMLSDEYSADVTHNVGQRATSSRRLDIDVVHVLRWRDGKVIEGRGAIFGDGTTQYDQFWSRPETTLQRAEVAGATR